MIVVECVQCENVMPNFTFCLTHKCRRKYAAYLANCMEADRMLAHRARNYQRGDAPLDFGGLELDPPFEVVHFDSRTRVNTLLRADKCEPLAADGEAENVSPVQIQASDLASRGAYDLLGQLMVDVLVQPHQELSPDADALYFNKRAIGFVAEKFGLKLDPASFHFPIVFTKKYVRPDHVGFWEYDNYFNLMIFAFVLGANPGYLPTPHDLLEDYYRHMADQQMRVIQNAAGLKCQSGLPFQSQLQTILDGSEDPASKERAIRSLLHEGRPNPAGRPQVADSPENL